MKDVDLKVKSLFVLLAVLYLSACATNKVMPPLQYNKPIDVRIQKNAQLHWEIGKQYASTIPSQTPHNAGLLGAVIHAAIDNESRKRSPSQYTMSYGKAEQAVFITSLRDILANNNVFKKVDLITDLNEVSAKDVLLNVYFKTAKVSSPERGYKITLSLEMEITGGGKPKFTRTYLVESDPAGFSKTFMDQKTEVSQKLLDKVISGIEQWQKAK